MMLVSMVGHASFQTAGASGPSMMERSYRLRSGRALEMDDTVPGSAVSAGAVTSVNVAYLLSRAAHASAAFAISTRTSASVLPDDFRTWNPWSAPSSQCIFQLVLTVLSAASIKSRR